MVFESILDMRKSPSKELPRPSFYLDLNINQIVDKIRVVWGEDVSSMYYYLPADAECEAYRRAVMQDVKIDSLHIAFKEFTKEIKQYRESVATGKQ